MSWTNLRSVTEMGYDWNYQFGGQMQIHWERFTFFWVHDRGDRRMGGWRNTRRVREELALRIQNGGLATQHDTEKRRESFLIWPIFDRNFNFQIRKSFNFI